MISTPVHIQSGLFIPFREWRHLKPADLTRGEKVCAFIERLLIVPEGSRVGKPMLLDPFQEQFILAIFDNPQHTRRAYLSMARKNGKTALTAAILLAFLVGPEARLNDQLVSGAMSRDQAALIFRYAVKIIDLSPKIRPLVRITPSSKKLNGLQLNTEFQALAADGKTAMGLSPRVAILDEVGQIRGPQSDFIDAITTSQGAHEFPLIIVLSTQAATDADLLSLWLDDAATANDPHVVSHVYTAPPDCALMDRDGWILANPALGSFRSETDLEEQLKGAERMPSAENGVRNLLLNQRISIVTPFVSPDIWKACKADPHPLEGMQVWGGLDLSARTDLTSLALIGRDAEGRTHAHVYFWTPEKGLRARARKDRVPYDVWHREGWLRTTPGATVDYAHVVADMVEILEGLDVQWIGFDRWRIDLFNKELEIAGIEWPMAPFGQGFKDMSPALDILEADLLNERLNHGNNPVLSMCAANAVVTRDPAGNRKLDKHKATGRIDGLVALTMAVGVAGNQEQEREPEYQMLVL